MTTIDRSSSETIVVIQIFKPEEEDDMVENDELEVVEETVAEAVVDERVKVIVATEK